MSRVARYVPFARQDLRMGLLDVYGRDKGVPLLGDLWVNNLRNVSAAEQQSVVADALLWSATGETISARFGAGDALVVCIRKCGSDILLNAKVGTGEKKPSKNALNPKGCTTHEFSTDHFRLEKCGNAVGGGMSW